MKTIVIETDRLLIRSISESDVSERYQSWFDDPQTEKYIVSKKPTLDELQRFVAAKSKAPNCIFLAVFEKESQIHVGNIKFEPIDDSKKESNFGILFAPDARGKGYAYEACQAAFNYIFESRGLKKVVLSAYEGNDSAIQLYEKLGFVTVGSHTDQQQTQPRRAVDMELSPR